MTDRHAGYIVTLAEDIREEEADAIIAALRMIKGVAAVSPVVSDLNLRMAMDRRDRVWRQALLELTPDPEKYDEVWT